MRNYVKRFIALVLSLILCLSMGIQAFAVENNPGTQITVSETEDMYTAAQQVYACLTDEQQEDFVSQIALLAIAGDSSLLEFHQTYVDPSYQFNPLDYAAVPNVADTASVAGQLQALNLPTAVYYGLLAFATSLGVPVGNVVDLVIGLGLGAIIIANWDAIVDVWDDIVDIFVDAFGSVVMDAFYYLQGLVGVYTVTVSGSVITINGEDYRCDTKAEEIALTMKSNGHSYYPAYRSGGFVWVCPVAIPRKAALAIMRLNDTYRGVFTVQSNYAYSICQTLGGSIRGPEGEIASGYWQHYHSSNYPLAHCWFIS